MTDEVTESELRRLTSADQSTAVAQCIDGLGCAVYAGGKELPPWASHKVQELVGIYVYDKAITTSSEAQYFILKFDDSTNNFTILRGPLSADELTEGT